VVLAETVAVLPPADDPPMVVWPLREKAGR